MITARELNELQKVARAATRHWLDVCQLHDQRMASAADVKAAKDAANAAESAYDRAIWLFQQEQLNAKPASRS